MRMTTLIFSLLSIAFSGCGSKSPVHPVDSSKAREALKTVLEGWKKGDSIESLKGASSITVQDLDWIGGAKLVSYELGGEGEARDSNLKVPVRLTLKNKAGKDVNKSVSYLITTSPEITVFRDFQ